MGFGKDLFLYMRQSKRYWLLPTILVLALLGFLLVYTGGSAISPFMYSLF